MSKSILMLRISLWIALVPMLFGCNESATRTIAQTSEQSTVANASQSEGRSKKAEKPLIRPPKSPIKAVPAPKRVHKLTQTSGRVDGPIEYIVVEPVRAPSETPLVVALHGWGDTPERFARLAEGLDLPVRTIVARGRQTGTRRGRSWFPRRDTSEQDLKQAVADLSTLIDQLAERYPGSPKPLLYGFSQGGMLALELLAAKPDCCSGVAALSAKLVRSSSRDLAPGKSSVLLSAGKSDTVVSLAATVEAKERFEAAGHEVDLLTFEGRHSVPDVVRDRLNGFIRKSLLNATKKKPAQP